MFLGIRHPALAAGASLAFLAAFAVFMPDQVTPLSGFQEAGVAAFAAALFGWLGVAGLAFGLAKLVELRAAKSAPEPAPKR